MSDETYICDDSIPTCSGLVDSVAATDQSSEQDRSIKGMHRWSSEKLLKEILDRLAAKKYDEVHGLVIAAKDKRLKDIFLELFPAIMKKYDEDYIETNQENTVLRDVITLVKSYGTTKEQVMMLLECADRVKTWKAFLLIATFMIELMPEIKEVETHVKSVIQEGYMKAWIDRFEENIKVNYSDSLLNKDYYASLEADYLSETYQMGTDKPGDPFIQALGVFLPVFSLSMSNEYHLLDKLITHVLACIHLTSYQLLQLIIELNKIYRIAKRPLPFETLILANSLKTKVCAVPIIYSSEYRLQIAMHPLLRSLQVSTLNMFNVGYVVLVLRKYLEAIRNESIGRVKMSNYMDFLALFLLCAEEVTLCELRKICMETFKTFLSKFEPVAQILIIRRLFSMVRKAEIQRKNLHHLHRNDWKEIQFEPQMLAWLIDLYRHKLNRQEFCQELGFFWGDLISTRYSSLSGALQYYMAVFIFAQQQALRAINPRMMLNVYERYLQPFQTQLSDWTVMVEAETRQMSPGNLEVPADKLEENMERLETETRRQQNAQSLPLLQFQYTETIRIVETFLRNENLLDAVEF